MTLLYATTNLITASTLDSVTSEDTLYVKEYLYNERPSLPFRFTAKTGNQIKVDLGGATAVTLVWVGNHNVSSGVTKFKIKAAAADPPAGGDWDSPDYSTDLALCTGLTDSYVSINQTYQYWVLDIDDAGNSDNTEIGEFFLGTHSNFGATFHLRGEDEGSLIHTDTHTTRYGQPWDVYLSEQKRFTLQVLQETTKGSIDAIETFLQDLSGSAGRFILIPDDTYCHSYFVKAEGSSWIANRVFHSTNDLRDWSLPLVELPKGITLL